MNWDKYYLISLKSSGFFDGLNAKKFHKDLTTANGVNAWWHHIDSLYILKVDYGITSTDIADYIKSIAPKKQFFVIEISLKNYNGWLPADAWEWLKKQQGGTMPNIR